MELILADVLGVEMLGGAAKVLGEASDGGNVALDGPGAVVAQLQVVDEALTQRRHGVAPNSPVRAPVADRPGRMRTTTKMRKSKST
jgi:hypothetical protein